MSAIDTAQIEPGQEVEIGLMRPVDAPGVAALFRAIYGEGYPVKTYYQPAALLEANQSGAIVSVVARTPKGDIVGHNAMYRIAPCPKVYEGGAGLTLPAYRNTAKLFTRMVAAGIEAVPAFGGEAVYGEHVCNHVFTQKVAASLGNIITGLAVDLMPAEAYDQEKSAQGRVSSLFGFNVLTPHAHQVYLPAIYDGCLRFVYEGIGAPRQMRVSGQAPPAGSSSRIAEDTYAYAQVTRITVEEVGEDLARALEEFEAKASDQGAVVFQAWLPLSCPWVGWAVEAMRARGYFLGGVLLRWFDEDGLLMQRLAHAPDWDSQQLFSERSQNIARFIRDDWQQVSGASA